MSVAGAGGGGGLWYRGRLKEKAWHMVAGIGKLPSAGAARKICKDANNPWVFS